MEDRWGGGRGCAAWEFDEGVGGGGGGMGGGKRRFW